MRPNSRWWNLTSQYTTYWNMTSLTGSRSWARARPMCLLPVLLASFVAAASTARQQPSTSSQPAPTLPPVTYDQSCSRTAMSQIAMDECVGTELLEVRRQLNVALASAERGGSTISVRFIKVAEQTFETYEKAECTVAAAPQHRRHDLSAPFWQLRGPPDGPAAPRRQGRRSRRFGWARVTIPACVWRGTRSFWCRGG